MFFLLTSKGLVLYRGTRLVQYHNGRSERNAAEPLFKVENTAYVHNELFLPLKQK